MSVSLRGFSDGDFERNSYCMRRCESQNGENGGQRMGCAKENVSMDSQCMKTVDGKCPVRQDLLTFCSQHLKQSASE